LKTNDIIIKSSLSAGYTHKNKVVMRWLKPIDGQHKSKLEAEKMWHITHFFGNASYPYLDLQAPIKKIGI
jgi:hypothetical protein